MHAKVCVYIRFLMPKLVYINIFTTVQKFLMFLKAAFIGLKIK